MSRLARVIGALAVSVVTAGGLIVADPAVAFADTAVAVHQVPCPSWVDYGRTGWQGDPQSVVAANPVFQASDVRFAINDQDTPQTVTFSSTTSTTFSITGSTSVSIGPLWQFLTINVSASITQSTTTSIGVSVQATVPPHTQVVGEYGVESFDVTYNGYVVVYRPAVGGCWVRNDTNGFQQETVRAPTFGQGWHVYQI